MSMTTLTMSTHARNTNTGKKKNSSAIAAGTLIQHTHSGTKRER
jgi:hypothetical protein